MDYSYLSTFKELHECMASVSLRWLALLIEIWIMFGDADAFQMVV